MQPNRRRAERVQLPEPMEAMLGALRVKILDLGLLGAKIEHDDALETGATATLRFFWRGEEINILARVMHNISAVGTYGEDIHQSGLEFVEAPEASGKLLRELIANHVMRMLEAQKANARGHRRDDPSVPFLRDMSLGENETRRNPEIVEFISYHLGPNDLWTRRKVDSPKQPNDGFTVLSNINDEQLELLKKAYIDADPSVRHLIRSMAEMSITEDTSTLPPKRLQ